MFQLFSKKKNRATPTIAPIESSNATTIMKLRENIQVQEKREVHLKAKMDRLAIEAKEKMAKGDKRGALFAMKKRKMHDAELAKIENVKMTLETQAISLEGAAQNIETFGAMKQGTKAMKSIHKAMGIDRVDDLMDDIKEEMDLHREVDNAFSQPIDPFMADDEDLLAELDALEAEEAQKASSSYWPVAPSRPVTGKKTEATPAAQATKSKFALFA